MIIQDPKKSILHGVAAQRLMAESGQDRKVHETWTIISKYVVFIC